LFRLRVESKASNFFPPLQVFPSNDVKHPTYGRRRPEDPISVKGAAAVRQPFFEIAEGRKEGLDMRLHMRDIRASVTLFALVGAAAALAADASGPDLIFRQSTDFKLLTPNDKLATYGIDDPVVEGVACYYTMHEKGGVTGALGLAENTSDVSLSCRQYGPVKFREKFSQGDQVFSERRSLFFKRMQIVRGCDVKRNVMVYMVFSDKLVEGSPENSTSALSLEPWGGVEPNQCKDFVK
jgi:CreA protein